MRRIAIITARTESKRFPNKVMANIEDKPMIQRIVDRIKESREIDEIVVATTPLSSELSECCQNNAIKYSVGSESDVLDRLYEVGKAFQANVIVRFWGDSPLLDARLIDRILPDFCSQPFDFAYLWGYPKGTYFNIMRFSSLEKLVNQISGIDRAIWNQVSEEWVWIINGFRYHIYQNGSDLSYINLEVNTLKDLERIRRIYRGDGDI